jgi:hypothetical protein
LTLIEAKETPSNDTRNVAGRSGRTDPERGGVWRQRRDANREYDRSVADGCNCG